MQAGRRLGLVGVLFLAGCGGATATGAEPETGGAKEQPAPASEEPAQPDDSPKAGAQDPEGEAPAAGGAAEPEAAPLSDKDIEAALQLLLGDAQLLDQLHLKQPGRSPLKVSGEKLPAKLAVIAGSHEVKVVPAPSSKKEAVLVFTKIEREGQQLKLHYRFDVEGLEGRATLSLKNGRWELSANRVIEK